MTDRWMARWERLMGRPDPARCSTGQMLAVQHASEQTWWWGVCEDPEHVSHQRGVRRCGCEAWRYCQLDEGLSSRAAWARARALCPWLGAGRCEETER